MIAYSFGGRENRYAWGQVCQDGSCTRWYFFTREPYLRVLAKHHEIWA